MRELLSDGSSRPPTCARASRRSSRSARRGSRVSEQLLIDRMLGGARVALARLMTLVENRAPGLPALMSRLHPRTGGAHVIGITGPPGAGKSTLTDRITARLRAAGHRVGIVAVDPTSPFSGGCGVGDPIPQPAPSLGPPRFIPRPATPGGPR